MKRYACAIKPLYFCKVHVHIHYRDSYSIRNYILVDLVMTTLSTSNATEVEEQSYIEWYK